ncbi:hypothetical protein RHGRI_030420 [Rhododendron griersonianum]|uniref:RING-type domain-containing protein n=1 Tax=Rhododendron griersonianum TaxID=479676 RepID=A0AAV6IQ32_9ERIC|nr:hypothetical protein RHGRI_030420 [Rhododendron griersonianum]
MPKEATVPTLSFDQSTASPYLSPAKIAKMNIYLIKFIQVVHSIKRDKEEVRCSICLERPHNAVLLQCPNVEEGCHSYMCHTNNRDSNCFSQFRNSTPTLSCPQCKGEVNSWFVLKADRIFMNSRPTRCSVETCEFTGTYLELVNHSILEHPLVREKISVPSGYHGVPARASEPSITFLNGSDLWREKRERKRWVSGERGFQSEPSKSVSDGSDAPSGYHVRYTRSALKNHSSVRPSVVDPVCKMRLERERDLEALSALHLS